MDKLPHPGISVQNMNVKGSIPKVLLEPHEHSKRSAETINSGSNGSGSGSVSKKPRETATAYRSMRGGGRSKKSKKSTKSKKSKKSNKSKKSSKSNKSRK